MDYERILAEVAEDARPLIGRGNVAGYIPPLASVDPAQFGIALLTVDGRLHTGGDATKRFSIQSISKIFSLALAFNLLDEDIWKRLGREPSGTPFNSLVQLEVDAGKPRNPFINSGALVVVDVLASHFAQPEMAVMQFISRLIGKETVHVDLKLAKAEQEVAHRNIAMGHFIKSFGNLNNAVDDVIRSYCWQCSILMSCVELVTAADFLARGGISSATNRPVLTGNQCKRVNALMATCGTYDAAGDFAYRVGLPAKSGVGGGILAVVPGRATICVWSPGLDATGNSLAGGFALERLAQLTGWSIY